MSRKRAGGILDQNAAKRRGVDDTLSSSGDSGQQRCANRTIEKKTRRYLGSILSHCHRIMKSINEQLGCPIVMKQMNREFETGNGSTKKYDCDFQQDPIQAIENWVTDVVDLHVIIDIRSLNAFARYHGSKKSTSAAVLSIQSKMIPSRAVLEEPGQSEDARAENQANAANEQVKIHASESDNCGDDEGDDEDEDDDDDRVVITVSSLMPATATRVNKPMIASSSLFNNSGANNNSSSSSRLNSTLSSQARVISSTTLPIAPESTDKSKKLVAVPIASPYFQLPPTAANIAETITAVNTINTNAPTSEDLSEYINNVKQLVLFLLYLYLVLFLQQVEDVLLDPFNQQIINRIKHSTSLSSSLPLHTLPGSGSSLQQLGKNHHVDLANLLDEKESKSLLQKLFVSSSEWENIRRQCWLQILEGSIKIDFIAMDAQSTVVGSPSVTPHQPSPTRSLSPDPVEQVATQHDWDDHTMTETLQECYEMISATRSIDNTANIETPVSDRSPWQPSTQMSSDSVLSPMPTRNPSSNFDHDPYHIVPMSDLDTSQNVDEANSDDDFDIMSESDSEVERDSRFVLGMPSTNRTLLVDAASISDYSQRLLSEQEDAQEEEVEEDKLVDPVVTTLVTSSQSVAQCVTSMATALTEPGSITLSRAQLQDMLQFVYDIQRSCDGIAHILSSAIEQ